MSTHRKLLIFQSLIFLAVFSVASAHAAPNANASSRAFQALTGQAASQFTLPLDVVVVGQSSKQGNITSRRYQQIVNGAAVLGGQITVNTDAQGNTVSVIGAHYPNLLSTNDIKLTSGNAQAGVAKKIGGQGKWFTRLMINPASGRFFYTVESRRADSRWFYWIDAEDGSVINSYDGLTTGDGLGVLGDVKDLTGLTTFSGNQYRMISTDGRITTNDAGNRTRLPGNLAVDDDDSWDLSGSNSPGQPALVDAHFYANVVDNYYQSQHSFNWLDHYSQGIVSSAHLKRNYNNAYWNGEQMAYGDGDGSTFIELSGDLDVVGHELTHGVTEATSNLIYQNESGALNEAFSDIMGTNIEFANNMGNWTIGEDITVGSNGIRNMMDPGEDGDPSHYDERYTGTSDNGGVHTNSGIINHWYYLLVMGGQNSDPNYRTGNSVTGIGLAAAEALVFDAFTNLTPTSDFCDARVSTLASGTDAEDASITAAWDEVGVTDALCSGTGGGGGGGGTGVDPVISDVTSKTLNGVKFQIKWTTDLASDSTVIFTCCGSYSDATLVTNHAMNFNGQKNVSYEYYVTSTTPDGGTSTAGPFVHNN